MNHEDAHKPKVLKSKQGNVTNLLPIYSQEAFTKTADSLWHLQWWRTDRASTTTSNICIAESSESASPHATALNLQTFHTFQLSFESESGFPLFSQLSFCALGC